MGSGHFLIRACQYLAEEIATNPRTNDRVADQLTGDQTVLTYWKRRVAEHCLYGVDLNPMAVELAKLALWLDTAASDMPLTFLDHHLRCGNSIIGARISSLDGLPNDSGLLAGQFSAYLLAALPDLLDPLEQISLLPSDNTDHVKQKEAIFKSKFIPAEARFSHVADIWCALALGFDSKVTTAEAYSDSVRSLSSDTKFSPDLRSKWAQSCVTWLEESQTKCFHWELSFPEVFFRHGRDNYHNGFDVIIGNPPYDVLSSRESGNDVEPLQAFTHTDLHLAPSLEGKNNMYKMFTCRALELLANGGYLGYIVPMTLLGDKQASQVRKKLLNVGDFVEVHAFPQKDDPNRRVFRDAKLSTVLFIYQKSNLGSPSTKRFRSNVHEAQFIENSSPSVLLDGASTTRYDSSNATILSCTQADWDLVTLLLNQLRHSPLGNFVSFHQGEINETNVRRDGFLTDNIGGNIDGQLVRRGASVTRYALRSASQGNDIYLKVDPFLEFKRMDSKAFDHRLERVALQEASPQNNFRRLIACRVPIGEFCNHTINYTTTRGSLLPLEVVLAILNSQFAEWYFRLGSTNAHVSQYQLKNIPCPPIKISRSDAFDEAPISQIQGALDRHDFTQVHSVAIDVVTSERGSRTVQEIICSLVRYIERREQDRVITSRGERSRLDEYAEEVQSILDDILFSLIRLSQAQREHIRTRLGEML